MILVEARIETTALLRSRFSVLCFGDLEIIDRRQIPLEKGVKSSARPNRNRDIFYCHAQSAGFSFSARLCLSFPCHSFYDAHRIAEDLLPPDQRGRYLNIRSVIRPACTRTRSRCVPRGSRSFSRRTRAGIRMIHYWRCRLLSIQQPCIVAEGTMAATFCLTFPPLFRVAFSSRGFLFFPRQD